MLGAGPSGHICRLEVQEALEAQPRVLQLIHMYVLTELSENPIDLVSKGLLTVSSHPIHGHLL